MTKATTAAEIKAIIDTANELKFSGETIHQVYGELSISLERLLTNRTITTTNKDGLVVAEETKWIISPDKRLEFIEQTYMQIGKYLLTEAYKNQEANRKLIIDVTSLVLLTIIIVFIINKFFP